MKGHLCHKALCTLAAAFMFAGSVFADTFEFLTYTPPAGWTRQAADNVTMYNRPNGGGLIAFGTIYKRPNGVGLIAFYPSYPTTGSPADEFAKMWSSRVAPTVPGPAPQPQIERESDYVAAIGAKQVDAQGTITTISLVVMVARGRAIGVMTVAAGDDVLRELTAFLDSLKVTPGAEATATAGQTSAGGIEVDFNVPAGYVSQRDGNMIILKPTTLDRNTPCIYGISPARPSSVKLETDAAAAILEPLPGFRLKSDTYNAMRGTSAVGWPYFWYRTDVQRAVGGSDEYLTAMAMALPAGAGRVNIIWGFGATGPCLLDDVSFARLFQSLRPRGWVSDGGTALARDLVGTWRDSQTSGIAQYKFLPNGRYEYGIGTVTVTGLLERTSSSVSDGRYDVRGGELIITPDRRDRGPTRFHVRIYDELRLGRWSRVMSLLNENVNPPRDLQYYRIDQ
jgi:hypothetical protein